MRVVRYSTLYNQIAILLRVFTLLYLNSLKYYIKIVVVHINFFVFIFYLQEHRELAREAVRKSLVLLKNGKYVENPLLPLSKNGKKILVTGSHADNLGYQCGGWTITWQGLNGNDLTIGMFH